MRAYLLDRDSINAQIGRGENIQREVTLGAERFLYSEPSIRTLQIWQSLDFWENALFSSLSTALSTRYGDVRHKMERWHDVADERRSEIAQLEQDVVFELASKFVFYQVHVGAGVDYIRKVLARTTQWTRLDQDKVETLNQMASNMIAANELMVRDTPDESTLDLVSPNGKFVLVGARDGGKMHGVLL